MASSTVSAKMNGRAEEPVSRTIFNQLLSQIKHTIDIHPQATPRHLRFIDCESFLNDSVLRIHEYLKPPTERYSAISYVWKGLQTLEGSNAKHFNVAGAEDADPISIDVLRTACLASIAFQSRLLWLDRLCIFQKDKADKSWQIQNMFDIYKNAYPCLILPGGLTRLASLSDKTTWIHRSWTLQESVAPTMAMCLFAWNLGPATSFNYSLGHILELEKGKSAMAHLIDLLNLALVSTGAELDLHEFPRDVSGIAEGRFVSPPHIGIESNANPTRIYLSIRIFGHNTSFNEKMHLALLAQALSSDGDLRENAIWRSSFLRTSSYAVDAVFSIMGLFGVTLDPSEYAKTERLQPTIKLMQKILSNGGRANWLTLSERSKLSYEFCLVPKFPETSVSREAFYRRARDNREISAAEYLGFNRWWPWKLPKGSMDNEGYFTFRAPALPLPNLNSSPAMTDFPKSSNYSELSIELYKDYELVDSLYEGKSQPHRHDDNSANSYAIWVGTKKPFRASGMNIISLNIPIFMLVYRPTSNDPFFCVGLTSVSDGFVQEQHFVEREFTVGGFRPGVEGDIEATYRSEGDYGS
ncbi:hypothetical protein F5B18DRAFT_645761 [Nemania serpens]|nr:hypothetical protein F5B18DRAFT_645761 [Nemania serpens]